MGQKRVLIAAGSVELGYFFPNGLPDSDENLCWKLIDTNGLNQDSWEKSLQEYDPEILLSAWTTPPLTEEIVDSPWFGVKYCCHLAGSVRKVVPESVFGKDIIVSNWGTLASAPVAEHALLLTLACLRRMPTWRTTMQTPREEYVRSKANLNTRTLIGKRVGLHGFGLVAREIVRLLKAFNVTISAHSEGVSPEYMQQHDVTPVDSLETLFAENEVLIECEALRPDNKGCIDASLINRLPSGAVFINVGRGALVDEDALIQRIRRGDIRVGLDVFESEPLPHHSPLFELDDVVLSPHIAGPTQDIRPSCGVFALENINRYLHGEPVLAQVDLAAYLRST
ncbi:hydroxyacid dehydrogenase [Ruficoccus sp. ZRK36]|uniref:hydroxyacid dehydrogenase n=1 Tax=Ruficoccus sp. ZRK36 TaxID=2866311 RepID=UPI001C73B1A8|nr:hydroxyacid dehydrogenase [Ruficoccus sp. ZRK36]QYY34341.1 hydroxyacid dehydrogenase [Ruficoccus sp. ZRK36]